MKKIIFLVVMLSVLVLAPVFAEETEKGKMPGMSHGASMDHPMGMPMHGMEKNCGPMMGKAQMAATKTQMVATDEGGVIVLSGNRLMKYDAELNLVKEAEVNMSMGFRGDKQCPMMEKSAAPVAAGSQEKAAAPSAAEPQEKTA